MRVLVVEDDALMAFDLADQLSRSGYRVIGPAVHVAEALRLIHAMGCDAAVLDVNLGEGTTSEPVAVELRQRSIPFIVVSGYTSEQHPPVFKGAPLIVKPIRFDALVGELVQLGFRPK